MARLGLPRTLGPVLLTAAFAPLLLVLGSVTAPHSKAAAPIHRPAPGPVSGAAVAAQIERAIAAVDTVTVTPVAPGPELGLWPTFVEYSSTKVAFSVSASGAPVPPTPADSVRYTDSRFVVYVSGEVCLAANRERLKVPWVCVSPKATDDLATSLHSTLPFTLGHLDPYSIVRALTAASSVTVEPPKPLDGETIHYHAVLDGDDYIRLALPTTTKELTALGKGGLEQDLDLLVSADGRPVQLILTVPALKAIRVQTYSNWGAAGHVALPGKSRVIDSADLAKELNPSG